MRNEQEVRQLRDQAREADRLLKARSLDECFAQTALQATLDALTWALGEMPANRGPNNTMPYTEVLDSIRDGSTFDSEASKC